MKLNVSAFALACGIVWGVGLFLTTWWLISVGDQAAAPMMFERVYVGYHITPIGSVIGLAYGFVGTSKNTHWSGACKSDSRNLCDPTAGVGHGADGVLRSEPAV